MGRCEVSAPVRCGGGDEAGRREARAEEAARRRRRHGRRRGGGTGGGAARRRPAPEGTTQRRAAAARARGLRRGRRGADASSAVRCGGPQAPHGGPDGGGGDGDGRRRFSLSRPGGMATNAKSPRLYRRGSLVPGHGCARY